MVFVGKSRSGKSFLITSILTNRRVYRNAFHNVIMIIVIPKHSFQSRSPADNPFLHLDKKKIYLLSTDKRVMALFEDKRVMALFNMDKRVMPLFNNDKRVMALLNKDKRVTVLTNKDQNECKPKIMNG